jgi:hypothetical protein
MLIDVAGAALELAETEGVAVVIGAALVPASVGDVTEGVLTPASLALRVADGVALTLVEALARVTGGVEPASKSLKSPKSQSFSSHEETWNSQPRARLSSAKPKRGFRAFIRLDLPS